MSHPINELFLALALSLVAVLQVGPGKGPHGIVPLRSSRVDVERILGIPKEASLEKKSSIYDLSDQTIAVTYSKERCDAGWNVPQDTVVRISIFPKVRPELTALELDLTKFEKVHGDHDVLDHFYYIDKEQGLKLSVRAGIVQEYIYEPTAADDHLRCAEYPKRPAMQRDCLPLGFAIDCSSEVIGLGSPVECKVAIAGMAKDVRPAFKWSVSGGASFCCKGADAVKVKLLDPTVRSVSLTVKVVSPKLCFDKASTKFQVVGDRN